MATDYLAHNDFLSGIDTEPRIQEVGAIFEVLYHRNPKVATTDEERREFNHDIDALVDRVIVLSAGSERLAIFELLLILATTVHEG